MLLKDKNCLTVLKPQYQSQVALTFELHLQHSPGFKSLIEFWFPTYGKASFLSF